MPEQETAPPTTATQDSAREATERMINGSSDPGPAERAQMEVARSNAELVATRGDWTLPARHQIDQAQLEVLRATVAKDCNPAELAMFLEVSARYGLDPFLKEIYAAKFDGGGGGVTIFTGRDGLLKAARNSRRFVRMLSALVCEKDDFEVITELGPGSTSDGVDVSHVTQMKHVRRGMGRAGERGRGRIIGAYALVWKAGDPQPWYAEASWEDYGAHRQKDGNNRDTAWTLDSRKGFPEAMMLKVPESIALRKAFGIAGIIGAEEIGDTPERVQNLSDPGGATGVMAKPLEVEYGDDELADELQALVELINQLRPGSWRDAKVAMRINGRPDEREKLRDTLRRAVGSTGEKGRERLEAIPFTRVDPPDAEVVQEPAAATQEPAAAPEAPEATQGTPGGLEGAHEPPQTREGRPEDEPEPEPEVIDGEVVELPPYDRSAHSALVDTVTELRGILEGMEGDEPTLELEESRAEAQRELNEALGSLEAMNRAAEAAGQPRVDV